MNRKHHWPESTKFFFGRELGNLAGASIHDDTIRLKNSSDAKLPGNIHDETYVLSGTTLNTGPNRQNAAAAILAARLMGCLQPDIQKALEAFKPLAHRMTRVADIGGVCYIDDSKATNVGAVYSALADMKQPVILIAGGRDKGGDYSILSELVHKKVKHMLLIGEARDKMSRAFLAFTNVELCESLQEAVAMASTLAVPGDAVLLSPACASFDMFSSYVERGEIFQKSVLALRNSYGGSEVKTSTL
jgi:UDP-N-acetylmuramoylalanine--D-glutamate ligase